MAQRSPPTPHAPPHSASPTPLPKTPPRFTRLGPLKPANLSSGDRNFWETNDRRRGKDHWTRPRNRAAGRGHGTQPWNVPRGKAKGRGYGTGPLGRARQGHGTGPQGHGTGPQDRDEARGTATGTGPRDRATGQGRTGPVCTAGRATGQGHCAMPLDKRVAMEQGPGHGTQA